MRGRIQPDILSIIYQGILIERDNKKKNVSRITPTNK